MFAGKKKTWIIAGAVVALAIIGGGAGAGIVVAGGGDDDQPITGRALDECTAAALNYTGGGGTVTETEVGDDSAAYGVEIRLDDGSQVEVNLDGNCDVIGQEADDDGPNDEDGPNDD